MYPTLKQLMVFLTVSCLTLAFASKSQSQDELTKILGILKVPPSLNLKKNPYTDGARMGGLIKRYEEEYLKVFSSYDKMLARKMRREIAQIENRRSRINYLAKKVHESIERLLQSGVALKKGLGSRENVQLTQEILYYTLVAMAKEVKIYLRYDVGTEYNKTIESLLRNNKNQLANWLVAFRNATKKKNQNGEEKLVGTGPSLGLGNEVMDRFAYLVRELLDFEIRNKKPQPEDCDLVKKTKASDACGAMVLPANRNAYDKIRNHQKSLCGGIGQAAVRGACFSNFKKIMAKIAKRNEECGCDRPCHEALGRELQATVEALR